MCVRCIYTSKFTYIPYVIDSKMSSVIRYIIVLGPSKLNYDTLLSDFIQMRRNVYLRSNEILRI